MRPEILNPLFAEVAVLPGIGPKSAKLLERLHVTRVADLLWLLPTRVVDRSLETDLGRVPEDAIATLRLRIEVHRPARGQAPYRVICADDTGIIDLVYFHPDPTRIEKALPAGEERLVSGTVARYQGKLQMVQPDYVVKLSERDKLPLFEPVYPLTAGLWAKQLRHAVEAAVKRLPTLPEWHDPALLARESWPGFGAAVAALHAPRTDADVSPATPAFQRLAYDELLATQLALALTRLRLKRQSGRAQHGTGGLADRVRAALPYKLTGAQERSLREILADMAAPERMIRLLQGDVGSGKTIVALLAMLTAVEGGSQAALMAPTEILARQHFASLAPLAAKAGVEMVLLTGREKGRTRDEFLGRIEAGDVPLVVGTHALFQETVAFKALGLAVVDEQHRFGVHQRLALSGKGDGRADVLVMTATPIPRTLTLTYYGDMDVSKLDERPPGRRPVATRAIPLARLDEVVDAVTRAAKKGERVYWVCPIVEESELIDVAAAEERFAALKGVFGASVALVHGRMKGPEKDRVMAAFKDGTVSVLVATTVIEVGVDVPEATVIVIEHAERFGLAQLHQLRGRVGRGTKPGSCLLLYQGPLGETAQARLKILRETDDGFRIAEEDLRLRGAGEVLGVKQSGVPAFRVARLPEHDTLLMMAHDDAALVLSRDADLKTARGEALRLLLYLFGRDDAIRFLRSG